jgi:Short C-terminal domain
MGAKRAERSQAAAQQEAAQNAQIAQLQAEQAAAAPPQAAAAPAAPAAPDETAEIQKYANMKEQGLITEEEFAAKKKAILGIGSLRPPTPTSQGVAEAAALCSQSRARLQSAQSANGGRCACGCFPSAIARDSLSGFDAWRGTLEPMRFHRKRRVATRAPANSLELADASFEALVAELDRRGCEVVGARARRSRLSSGRSARLGGRTSSWPGSCATPSRVAWPSWGSTGGPSSRQRGSLA